MFTPGISVMGQKRDVPLVFAARWDAAIQVRGAGRASPLFDLPHKTRAIGVRKVR